MDGFHFGGFTGKQRGPSLQEWVVFLLVSLQNHQQTGTEPPKKTSHPFTYSFLGGARWLGVG